MKIDYQTDEGVGTKANFGLVVLQSDETIEYEISRILKSDGIALYHTRIPMHHDITPQTLAEMEKDLPAAVAMLPRIDVKVIGYGCTSAATVIGSKAVAAAIHTIFPTTIVTDPIDSLITACNYLNAKKIAYVSPYVAEVSAQMQKQLETSGFNITSVASFEQCDDRVVARISPQSILSAIEQVAGDEDCDAVVVSCTALRTARIIAEAERRIDRPVISSNLALAWNMLRSAGIETAGKCEGMLFNGPQT